MSANPKLLAIVACLLAATLWGLLWFPLRVLEQQGLPGLWATIAIYIPALLVVLPFLLKQPASRSVSPAYFFLLALAAGWTNLAFILAMLEGKVVRVLLLFYLAPVWTLILSRFFLNERISAKAYLHLGLAFFGAMVLLWDEQMSLKLDFADMLAISSGFAFAVTNIIVRKIGDIPIIFKMVPAWLGVLFLAGLWLWFWDVPTLDLSFNALFPALILAAAIGVFGMVIMTYSAQYGVTHLPVHQSATLFLFEVPVGAVSAALLSQEIMTYQEWFGGALVMIAAWLSAKSSLSTPD